MKQKPTRRSRTTSQALGLQMFCAISAVEGLRLNATSKKRIDTLLKGKLTPAQRRAEVLKAYTTGAGRPSKVET